MDQSYDKAYWQLIWDQFKAGDRHAFEMMYNEFIGLLFSYGSRITSDKAMVEDAIQDVFIDVYRYGKSLQHPECLEYYLLKTLKNNIVRKLTENKRFNHDSGNGELFELKFPFEETDPDGTETETRLWLLQEESRNLDNCKREMLFLKFNSGLTYTEIGLLLDQKPDTVKKQIQRILHYFRKQFQDRNL